MTDKRVIVGIIIFIIFGLFIYSFAATPNNKDLDGRPTGSNNDSSSIGNDGNTGNNKPDENDPDENDPDENDPNENDPDENDPDENDPNSGSSNGGSNNSGTSKPNTGNNGGTSKPNTGNNGGNTGNNGGNTGNNGGNTGNNGGSNTGNNGGNTGTDIPEVPDEPDVPRPTLPTFSIAENEPANVHVVTEGNQIIYKGEMDKKDILVTETGKRLFNYIFIKIESPDALTQEEFENIKIVYNGKEISKDEINIDSKTKKAYLNFTQSFNKANGDSQDNLTKVNIDFYWGHGKTTSYTMIFDIVVNEKEAE